MTLLGYFDSPSQGEPAFDPGLSVVCPFCARPLDDGTPRVTTSLMDATYRDRSYFYRAHKACNDALGPEEVAKYDDSLLSRAAQSEETP